VRLNEL